MKSSSNPSQSRIVLFISLALNLIFLFAGGYYLYAHGWLRLGSLRHRADTDNFVPPDQKVRPALFHDFAARPALASLVFLGDSITEYCEWDEILGQPALNRGIAGDRTAEILDRMDAIAALHPRRVFLMAGTNDVLRNVDIETFTANYEGIIDRIRRSNPQVVVYVESVPPILSSAPGIQWALANRSTPVNPLIRSMNERIKKMADGRSVVYVDLYADLQKDGELNPDYTVDGYHLNSRAYQIWKQRIAPFTRPN